MVLILLLSLSCGSNNADEPGSWHWEKGEQADKVLDYDVDTLPDKLICEDSYTVAGSQAVLVDDCASQRGTADDNPICAQAFRNAFQAATVTNCPEPPPVSCPKRAREVWRGWRCGETPGLTGIFANCAVQIQVSCSQ
jgi:hypothetical protein